MGEWHIEEVDGDNPIVWIDEHMYFVAEHDPSMIVNTHNADCAAFRAELARVKAESLRVVADGEAGYPGSIGDSFRLLSTEGYLGIQYSDEDLILLSGPDEEMLGFCDIHPDTIVQPVRLERWEATE